MAKGDVQEQRYAAAAEEFGAALVRLARAYEADPDLRLDLVQEMIVAGLGVGLLPASRAVRGVTLRRLRQPEVILRSYAVTRRGHDIWPPLALVLRLIADAVRLRP